MRGNSAGQTRSGRPRVRAAWTAAALLLVAAGIARGQSSPSPDASGALASLRVAGGAATLARFAGVDEATPRGLVLLQVIRAIHESPTGADPARDRRLERLHAYLGDLSGFLRARRALPDGRMSAGLAQSQASRRGVEEAARAIGSELDEQGGAYRLRLRDDEASARRRQNLEEAGVDLTALAQAFNSGEAASLAVPVDDVPLPLDAGQWVRLGLALDAGPEGLLAAMLGDRRASLLYYGLMGLDAETRAYMGARPALVGELMKGHRPEIFASLGRSIRVRAGVIDVAGGPEAATAWEALLRQRTADPGPFMLELLDRQGGRAALLYDAIDHLDPPRQAFALALRMPDPGSRADHLRALLAACDASLDSWDPEVRPFRRVLDDPVHLLVATHVLPSGDLPAPAGRRFWHAALASSDIPEEPERLLESDEPDRSADAAWLVEEICVARGARRQQMLRTWLFGQRVFSGLAPSALPEALVALRGYARFPMLLLTLERIGVAAPAGYATAVRHAQRLGEIGDRDAAAAALRQFQGALAILERVRFSRAVSLDAALQLLEALTSMPPGKDGDYQGRVGAWLDTRLLPALETISAGHAAMAGTAVSAEATLLAAMAGVSSGASLPEVEWEGLEYRVDVGMAEFARMVRIRRKQGGLRLDAVLAFGREPARLRNSLKSPADVAARVAALTAAAEGVMDPPSATANEDETASGVRKAVNQAVKDLRAIRSPRDVSKAMRIAEPLQRTADTLLAGVLAAMAYAPHLGDPDGPELLAGDPSTRHRFVVEERIAEIRATSPWRAPQRVLGAAGGWHATGSLLGLDIGLSVLALRRLDTDGMPPPPGGNDIDRAAVASAVVLSNPFALSDAERDTLADAIGRGRARVRGVEAHPAVLPGLARAAGVSEWWREALLWAQVNEPGRVPEYFSLADLARIGEAEAAPGPPLDSWGAAWLDTEGCPCLRYPRPGVREVLAGRLGTALVAEQFVDLQLRTAEALARLGLPAQLARAVMALAAQDVLDTYQPAYIDDWTGLMMAVRGLPDSRFVDYVAALTSGGPLVPDDRERAHDVRR
ncbi:MAG: hypothetical protein R6V57_19010 [Vicinamibacterales bacterium]